MARFVDLFGDAVKRLITHPDLEIPAHLGECGAPVGQNFFLGLAEAVVQALQEGSQCLGAGDQPTGGLADRDGAFFEILRKVGELVVEIQSKPQQGQGGGFGSGDGFDQKPGHFAILQKKVVGPFQKRLQTR